MVFGSFRKLALACAVGCAASLVACGQSKHSREGDAGERGADDGDDGGSGPSGGRGGSGGSGGRAGSGTTGGSSGNTTTNIYVSELRTEGVDKVDILLMIDNSISMGTKQELMADALPLL